MRWRFAIKCFVNVSIAILLSSRPSAADEPPPRTPLSGPVLLILYQDAMMDADSTIHAVQASLSDMDIPLEVRWEEASPPDKSGAAKRAREVAEDSGALMAIWCDATLPREINLLVPGAEGGEIQSRLIDVSSQESAAETLALIVRSGVATLRGDLAAAPVSDAPSSPSDPPSPFGPMTKSDDAATKPQETENETPPPKTQPPEVVEETHLRLALRRRGALAIGPARWLIEGAFVLRVQSDAHPALVGGDLLFGVRAVSRLYLFAGLSYFAPTKDKNYGVTLTIHRFPARLGGRYAFVVGRFHLGPSLALELEPLVKRVDTPDGIALEDSGPELELSLVPALFAAVHLTPQVRLFLAAGLEILLNEQDFVVKTTAQTNVTVHDPWPVQPTFHLGGSILFY